MSTINVLAKFTMAKMPQRLVSRDSSDGRSCCLAKVMVGFLAAMLGHVRGGMSYVLLGAMLLVSGISGSKTADMAAVAPGYSRKCASAA